MVLKSLHAGERGGTGDELVGEVALVLVLLVHLTVSVVGFVCDFVTFVKVGCGETGDIPQPQAILC